MQLDSPMADRVTGLILFVLGVSMSVGGYTMDRLEIRQIHPASIPGLLPMGLGVAMALCALLLVVSAGQSERAESKAGDDAGDQLAAPVAAGSYKNLLMAAFLTVGYGAGLVGNMPFVAATAIFIFLFSVIFLWPTEGGKETSWFKVTALCAAYAVVFAIGISALFRYAFLVRLP